MSDDSKWTYVGIFSAAVICLIVGGIGFAQKEAVDAQANYVNSVNVEEVLSHLSELQAVALRNGNTRAVGIGYNQSGAYVLEKLRAAGYNPVIQPLTVPVYVQQAVPQLSALNGANNVVFANNRDFSQLRYGGNGQYNLNLSPVRVDNFGCNISDWNVIGGREVIALVAINPSGDCEIYDKVFNGQQTAGVRAVIVFRTAAQANSVLPTARARKTGWVEGDPVLSLPAFAATWTTAQTILAEGPVNVTLVSSSVVTMEPTFNIIADTPTGNAERIVVSGSHLDSVPEGPGLNDNGSGSSMNLELALRFAGIRPTNKVRFAWWAAEEIGLLGAYHYVNQLSPQERRNHAVALNFDMMASPNGVRYVHNGSEVPVGTDPEVIARNNYVMTLFLQHFRTQERTHETTPMLAGSDFLPFLVAQIPAGGLATGAAGLKSMPQRTEHGGLANAQMDPCYHQPCDTWENVGRDILEDNSRAAATVIWQLAFGTRLTPIPVAA